MNKLLDIWLVEYYSAINKNKLPKLPREGGAEDIRWMLLSKMSHSEKGCIQYESIYITLKIKKQRASKKPLTARDLGRRLSKGRGLKHIIVFGKY